jgi:hypothetical protein
MLVNYQILALVKFGEVKKHLVLPRLPLITVMNAEEVHVNWGTSNVTRHLYRTGIGKSVIRVGFF